MTDTRCDHMGDADLSMDRGPAECEDCVKEGTTWVHLRRCLICGHVGCCDSSPRRHARRHWHDTGHPLIRSNEPGEDWMWCYEDDSYVDSDGHLI